MLLIFTYIAVFIFMAGLICRGANIARMPVHLRWELAPVPHEKGKGHYGGSYLEEFEWWTKPREKSLLSEGLYMFQEIVFLKGVWEHNRSLWIFSFPFHFGLYLLTAMTACLAGAALVPDVFRPAAWIFGAAGYILGAFGALGLLIKRAFDPKLKTFASLSSYFNLVFLAALFLSGAAALFSGPFLCQMTSFIRAFFTVNPGITLDAPITAHIIIAMLFLVYLPFTYMMHFVAKYFTYHEVRWNDEPMAGNAAMEKEVKQLLSQKVTWAAKHIGADGKKNWVDIATMSLPEEKKNA